MSETKPRPKALSLTWIFFAIVSLYLTRSLLTLARGTRATKAPLRIPEPLTYSNGISGIMPVPNDQQVRTMIEESVHYDQSTLQGEDEWLYSSPLGTGSYRVGPNDRAYFLTMLHQFHCVQQIGLELTHASKDHWRHLQHCLNFLREMAMCRPDLTLEPGDFTKRNFTEDRVGEVHLCRDWKPVYDEVTRNTLQWYKSHRDEL